MENPDPAKRVVKSLTINLHADGTTQIVGPLGDRLVCFGLLGEAQFALVHMGMQAQDAGKGEAPLIVPEPLIVPATAIPEE
jgi:hypothetical protein